VYSERVSTIDGAVVWTRTGPVDDVFRVLPDACMDIMWLGDELVVAGPDTTAHLFSQAAGSTFTGVRFAPGTGPLMLGVPARELRDLRVPLDAVWAPCEVHRLRDRIERDESPGLALEHAAMVRSRQVSPPEPLWGVVVRELRAGGRVASAAALAGMSERQLRRRALDVFGYGPKMLGRILRMRRALELASSGVTLAHTAARAGYADQAHMTREVRSLAGVSLTALLG
jgi:AraC-like DNA-binding protein